MEEGNLPSEIAKRVPGWRRKYKHVYSIELFGNLYVFRPLSWAEFRELGECQQNSPASYMKIVEAGLLWPSILIDDCLAGIPHKLFQMIMEISGFGNQEAFSTGLDWARKEVKTGVDYMAIAMICKAFPYKPEDLDKKPFLDIMLLLAMSEQILEAELTLEEPEQDKQDNTARRKSRMHQVREGLGVSQRANEIVEPGVESYEVPQQEPRVMSKSELMNPSIGLPDFEKENFQINN